MTVKKTLKFIMFKAHIIDCFVKWTLLLYRRARPQLYIGKTFKRKSILGIQKNHLYEIKEFFSVLSIETSRIVLMGFN